MLINGLINPLMKTAPSQSNHISVVLPAGNKASKHMSFRSGGRGTSCHFVQQQNSYKMLWLELSINLPKYTVTPETGLWACILGSILIMLIMWKDLPTLGDTIPWLGFWTVYVEEKGAVPLSLSTFWLWVLCDQGTPAPWLLDTMDCVLELWAGINRERNQDHVKQVDMFRREVLHMEDVTHISVSGLCSAYP